MTAGHCQRTHVVPELNNQQLYVQKFTEVILTVVGLSNTVTKQCIVVGGVVILFETKHSVLTRITSLFKAH